MALILTCPHCTSKLKTKQRINCGDPATCPKCNQEFIAADIVEESTRPDLPPVLPASHPQSALPVRDEPKSQRSKRVEPEEETRGRDEEMIAARYQWRGNSDSSRSRSRDDDEPSSRRGRYDEDRSARDRDDRSPRRRIVARRRRKRRGQNRNVLYFALSFAGALALMGIVLLIVHLANNGDGEEEMLACLSADTHMVTCIDIESISNNRTPLGLIDQFKLDDAGLARADIQKLLLGESQANGAMLVVRLKSSFNKARFLEFTRSDQRKENGKIYYHLQREPGPRFAYLDSNSLLVLTDKEEAIRDMLRRDRNKPVVSDSIQELAKSVSSGHVWLVSTETNGRPGLFGGGFDGGEARGFAVSAKLSGSQMEIKLAFLSSNSESATRMRDRLQLDLDRAKRRLDDEMRNSRTISDREENERSMIGSASVQRDGSLVTITSRGKNPWGEREGGGGGGGGGRDLFQMFR